VRGGMALAAGRGRGGDRWPDGSPKLPPLPRPVSAEDIDAARRCLVLLKAKMPIHRRSPRERRLPQQQDPARNAEVNHSSGASGAASVRSSSPGQQRGQQPPPPQPQIPRRSYSVPARAEEESPGPQDWPAEQAKPVPGNSGGFGNGDGAGAHASAAAGFGGNPGGAHGYPQEVPETSTGPLVQCEDCGRSFNQESIDRHRKICKKVFQQKRKKFDSAANRLGQLENAGQLINNAKRIEQEAERVREEAARGNDKEEAPQQQKPLKKWEIQSLQFRQAMLDQKAAAGDEKARAEAAAIAARLSAAAGSEPGDVVDPDKSKCPHCGRTFNKEAAERHIAVCVKTFGSKPGGGRLLRGGGKNMLPPKQDEGAQVTKPLRGGGVGSGIPRGGTSASHGALPRGRRSNSQDATARR